MSERLPGSLELAYLGDTLYDLFVRERLVRAGGRVKDLNRQAVALVCAASQSRALARLAPILTEAEADVARRARNAHQSPPRNVSPAEYHRATAIEALMGYLYLTGQTERLAFLMDQALRQTEEEGEHA